ncbi:MAG: hypothetical protein RTU92_10490 [Candidatus Thorarchaeota archaeon]
MERQRVVIAFMSVMVLGSVLSTVGMMVASGVDQGGSAYYAFYTTFLCFNMLSIIVIAVFGQDFSKDEPNQSQAELDSSLF